MGWRPIVRSARIPTCRVLYYNVLGREILKERHRDLKSGERGESNSVTRTHTPFLHIPMLSKQTDGNKEQAHGKHSAESSQTIDLSLGNFSAECLPWACFSLPSVCGIPTHLSQLEQKWDQVTLFRREENKFMADAFCIIAAERSARLVSSHHGRRIRSRYTPRWDNFTQVPMFHAILMKSAPTPKSRSIVSSLWKLNLANESKAGRLRHTLPPPPLPVASITPVTPPPTTGGLPVLKSTANIVGAMATIHQTATLSARLNVGNVAGLVTMPTNVGRRP